MTLFLLPVPICVTVRFYFQLYLIGSCADERVPDFGSKGPPADTITINLSIMLQTLLRNWWSLALRGVIAIAFGILALINPAIAATSLVLWLSIFIMLDGAITLAGAVAGWKDVEDKWILIVEGVVSLLIGLLLFRSPNSGLLIVALFIGFWSIFSGVSKISLAIQLRKEMEGEGWLALAGVFFLVFGLIVLSRPGIAVATLMYLIGGFAIVAGLALVLLGLKVRSIGSTINRITTTGKINS